MHVRSTYTMASKALRSSIRRRPPLACDEAAGISGHTRSHTSSLTSHGLVLAIHSSSTFFLLFYHLSTGFRISFKCATQKIVAENGRRVEKRGKADKHFGMLRPPRNLHDRTEDWQGKI